MTKAPIEYQSSAKVKIERRPNRSDSQLKASVPVNRPRKSAATKLAKPFRSNRPCVVGVKMPALNRPVGVLAGEERSENLEQPARENSATRRRVWRDGGSRSSRAATVTAGPVAISLPPSIFRQRHSRLPPR